MKHGSLFSGIGGFDLAAKWAGWENVFQVEKDSWCRKVLAKNFPETARFDDIINFQCHEYRSSIDIISGGFPCQPFSVAGKRAGKEDDRYLWHEMLRVIRTIRPAWVVGENVAGIVNMELDTVLSDLEDEGYATESYIIPACGKNAWHRRDRVWIVAHADGSPGDRTPGKCKSAAASERLQKRSNLEQPFISGDLRGESFFPNANCKRVSESIEKSETKFFNANGCSERVISNANNTGCKEQRQRIANESELFAPKCDSWWQAEPGVGRVVNGLPNRVDRLKGLGNAIVPQIAFEIFNAINHANKLQTLPANLEGNPGAHP